MPRESHDRPGGLSFSVGCCSRRADVPQSRQRCLGLGHEPAQDLADPKDFFDGSGGLARREQILVSAACLSRREHLTSQAIAVATGSSRLPPHSSRKAVRKERSTVWKPAVPGSGLTSLRTWAFTVSSDLARTIACFHSSAAGASAQAMNRVPRWGDFTGGPRQWAP